MRPGIHWRRVHKARTSHLGRPYARLTAELAPVGGTGRRRRRAPSRPGLLGPRPAPAFQRTRLARARGTRRSGRRQLASISAMQLRWTGASPRTAAAGGSTPLLPPAATVTPDAAAWRAVAEAEYTRSRTPSPERWQAAVAAWDELERPYPAAYCRWRPPKPSSPAAQVPRRRWPRGPPTVRLRLGAARSSASSSCSPSAPGSTSSACDRRMLAAPSATQAARAHPTGAEVLQLLGRGYTNREIAAELTISVKTASVHVSNILRKLDVEPAGRGAIAQRLAPPSPPRRANSDRPLPTGIRSPHGTPGLLSCSSTTGRQQQPGGSWANGYLSARGGHCSARRGRRRHKPLRSVPRRPDTSSLRRMSRRGRSPS